MKQWWDITEEDQKAIMENTEWCMADNGYFRGGGYSSRYETRAQMPATMIRLNLVKGLGPVLQIAEGWTVALPEEVSDKLWKRTDYTWPCTWFAPRCDGKEGPFKTAYDVMNNWGANHGAISYGHIGADLITMCSMLRIPVCMHNVPEADVFRPAAWNAFWKWIKKVQTSELARIMDLFINNLAFYNRLLSPPRLRKKDAKGAVALANIFCWAAALL